MASTDALPVPRKNVAYRVTFPILDADGDLVTGAATPDSEVSIDAGIFADLTAEATEIATSSGIYYVELTAAEMNGDTIAVIVKTGTAGAKTTPIVMYPQQAGDIKVDVDTWLGTAPSALQTGRVDAYGGALATGVIATGSFAAGAINAAAIATGAIDADALATDAVAEIADGVWDEPMAGHLTLATYGQVLRANGLTGEVNDLTASTTAFIVDGFTEATNDHFNGMVMVFTSGALLGEARVITDYTGATQTMTFGEAWTDAPADNDDFVIVPASILGGTLAQIFRLFVTILDPTTGQADAGSFAAGAIDAAAIATDAIGSAELSLAAAQKVRDTILSDATTFAGANINAAITTRATPVQVNAEVVDALNVDTYAEPGSVPAATTTLTNMVHWLFTLARNKITQTATTQTLRNDADAASISTAAVSDDGTTATRAEWV